MCLAFATSIHLIQVEIYLNFLFFLTPITIVTYTYCINKYLHLCRNWYSKMSSSSVKEKRASYVLSLKNIYFLAALKGHTIIYFGGIYRQRYVTKK